MAGYDMKGLEKDLDSLIRELREIRKEMALTRKLIQRQQRLQFPLIDTEQDEEE